MAKISEISSDERYEITFNTDNGDIEVKDLVMGTWFGGFMSEESVSVVAPMIVPGFGAGDVLYAVGYYIASKISGGSSAK